MSDFFSSKYDKLTPYTPGEQPRDMKYNKLNTNESPFPPSKKAQEYASEAIKSLQLYSDPECTGLVEALAKYYGVERENVICVNGSDEVLNFAFMAFCDENTPAVFPDITYGFYPVFAALNNISYREIPLRDDFTIDINDYMNVGATIFIANPNAPTGIALSLSDIEEIVKNNPNNVVVVDEAYVDYGTESAVSLINKYNNLLVTQTFSKSRSLAGGRLGYGIACADLIRDLNTIRYSTNPYNINKMTMAAGIGAIEDDDYFKNNCKTIMDNRAYTVAKLEGLGFHVLPSKSNFVFAKSDIYPGKELYLDLKANGILIRHFDKPRLDDYNRITIGSREQMDALISMIEKLMEEKK